MDFGFMWALASDYSWQDKMKDHVVCLYHGYSSYLLVIDKASRFAWIFLTASKDPLINIVRAFLAQHGHASGGCISTNQGGELAKSPNFQDLFLRDFNYTIKPTGTDSPSQNSSAEIYNKKFAVRSRTLLYCSGLPAKFWLVAFLHSVYLPNRLVHQETKKTPFKGYYSCKPDLPSLKLFGARVCVKCTGNRRGKLDCHKFTGVFLGYAATDQNIIYLDLDSGIVKISLHAQFDETWYLQPSGLPVAQLLYDLGLENDEVEDIATDSISPGLLVPWQPILPKLKWLITPLLCCMQPLPLCETGTPQPIATAAARTSVSMDTIIGDLPAMTLEHLVRPKLSSTLDTPPFSSASSCVHTTTPSNIVTEYLIDQCDMSTFYMSLDPYFDAFDKVIDLKKFNLSKHQTAGLCLQHSDDRLYLGGMTPSTHGAKIPRWQS
jgi:hypothetical protein